MNGETRYFGLHLTRTAGTALYDMAQRVFGRSACLVVSSFTQMELDHEQAPQERLYKPLPLFSFGHYVHESIWGAKLQIGPVFSFTVLREPKSRLRSTVRQMERLVGLDQATIRERLTLAPNPMCAEILRCVPAARLLFRDEPLHIQALAALSAFDRVASIRDLPQLVDELLVMWAADKATALNYVNATELPIKVDEFDGFQTDDYIGEDVLLWDRVNRENWRFNGEKVVSAIRDIYSNQRLALELFRSHLDHFHVEELKIMGTTDSTVAKLQARRAELERLARRLEQSN